MAKQLRLTVLGPENTIKHAVKWCVSYNAISAGEAANHASIDSGGDCLAEELTAALASDEEPAACTEEAPSQDVSDGPKKAK